MQRCSRLGFPKDNNGKTSVGVWDARTGEKLLDIHDHKGRGFGCRDGYTRSVCVTMIRQTDSLREVHRIVMTLSLNLIQVSWHHHPMLHLPPHWTTVP